jgi:polyisoprenoid-binding protein YceI
MRGKTRLLSGMVVFMLLAGSCNTFKRENAGGGSETGIPVKGVATLMVDPAKSTINWRGEMLGVYSHFGTVGLRSGTLTLTDGMITAGGFQVDLRTILPKDGNYTEDSPRENLVAHLESEDFFDVENHPLASFTITSTGARTVSGTMTIRNISRPETFGNVSVIEEGNVFRIKGEARIDRRKYGAAFEMKVPDMLLSNDIQLMVDLVAEMQVK